MSSEQKPAIMQVVDKLTELITVAKGDSPDFLSNRWDSGLPGGLHTTTSDRVPVTTRHRIGVDGTLTGIKVRLETGNPQNNIYVEITIADNDNKNYAKIMQGYVNLGSEPFGNGAIPVKADWEIVIRSWASIVATMTLRGTIRTGKIEPGGWTGTDQDRLEGRGHDFLFAGSNPAAGANATDDVPTGALWAIKGYRIRLVTDATAIARRTCLISEE